jgi:hypothetical protein
VEWTGGEIAHMGKDLIQKFMEEKGYKAVSSKIATADLFFIKNV